MSDDDRIEHRRPRTNRLKRSPGLQRTASIRLSPRIQEILSPASFGSFGSPRSPNTPRSYSHDKPIKSPRDGQFSPTGAEREPLNRMKSLETPSMARPGFSGKFSPDFYSRSHSMDSPTFSSLSGCHSRYITSPTRSMQYGTEGPPIEDILNTTSNSGDEFQRFAERKPLYVINPITSNFRKVWDIFLGFLIVYRSSRRKRQRRTEGATWKVYSLAGQSRIRIRRDWVPANYRGGNSQASRGKVMTSFTDRWATILVIYNPLGEDLVRGRSLS